MRGFLANLTLRPSCHHCSAKAGRSGSDINIGDFWGVGQVKPQMDDDRGTSVVMIRTDKGNHDLRRKYLKEEHATYEVVVKTNTAIETSVKVHPRRDMFFSANNSENMQTLVERCLMLTKLQKTKNFAKSSFRMAKTILRNVKR